MSMLNIAAVVAAGLLLSIVLRQVSPSYAFVCTVLCGIAVILMMLPWVEDCFSFMAALIKQSAVSDKYVQIILKAIGTAYIAQFTSEICEDAGEKSLAGRVELAEKIYLTVLSLPIFADILSIATNIVDM